MNRTTVFASSFLVCSLASGLAAAQYPPQQYPPQQYPQQQQQYPQQQYPQQQYPQQQYPQQQYPQQQYAPPPSQYPAPPMSSGQSATFGSNQLIVSADRLFGLSFWSAKTDFGSNLTQTQSGTAVNLLWGDNDSIAGPYVIPRLGIDYAFPAGFTIGGSATFISKSSKVETSNSTMTQSNDAPTVTAFAVAPRFGYILAINPMIGLWFKGGITLFTQKSDTNATLATGGTQDQYTTVSGFALNLEPALVVTPVQHFGLTASVLGDIGLTGNVHCENTCGGIGTSQSQDFGNKIYNFGLALGILGYL